MLCGLCVLFTVAHFTTAQRPGSLWYEMGQVGRLPADAVWSGRYEQLFLTVFVHGSPTNVSLTLMHLGFNALWLLRLGATVEETLHPLGTALFYVSAAIVASGCELAATGRLGVGASGVVYAIFGLMWAGRSRYLEWGEIANPANFAVFVGWGLFCVFITWMGWLGVANAAHFGGLLFGMSVGWLFVARKRPFVGGLVLGSLLVLTAMSLLWMPWSKEWTKWKGIDEAKKGRFDQAYRWLERSLRQGHEPEPILAAVYNVYNLEVLRRDPYGAAKAIELMYRLQGKAVNVQPTEETLQQMGVPVPSGGTQQPPGTANPSPPSGRIQK